MDLLSLPPEIINFICGFLPLNDCFLWKLTCHYYNELLSGFDDLFQARYLYKLGEQVKINKRWYLLIGMIGKLEKGKNWIIRNNPTWLSNYIFIWCCKTGDVSSLDKMLLDPRVDPSKITWKMNMNIFGYKKMDHNMLEYAVFFKQVEIVNRLLEDERVDPTNNNNLVIYLAAKKNNLEIFSKLLEDTRRELSFGKDNSLGLKGLEIPRNSVPSQPAELDRIPPDTRRDISSMKGFLVKIISFGHPDIVSRLLKHPDIDPSDNNNEAIRYAFQQNERQRAEDLSDDELTYILGEHADGATDHIEITRRVLEDPNVDQEDKENLQIYTKDGYFDIVKILMKDQRVVNKLSENDKRKYMKMVNLFN